MSAASIWSHGAARPSKRSRLKARFSSGTSRSTSDPAAARTWNSSPCSSKRDGGLPLRTSARMESRVGFMPGQFQVSGFQFQVNWKRELETFSFLRDPHPALLAPHIVGLPHLEADGKIAARFGDEDLLVGMRDLRARDQVHFLGDALVDQDAVADLHRVFGFPPGIPSRIAPASHSHSRKVASPRGARQSPARPGALMESPALLAPRAEAKSPGARPAGCACPI